MIDIKGWLFSRGVWGGAIAFVGVLANLFGYNFGMDDQTLVGSQIDNIITAVGTLLGVYGRIMATKQLRFGG